MEKRFPSMKSAKSLSDDQIKQIQAWADEGDGIPEIQKKLRDEFELRVTYLETRFLLEDLKIELRPAPLPEPEAKPVEEALPETVTEGDDSLDEGPGEGDVKVSLDTLLRPGALISGKVDFGGGNKVSWWLDQMGRLGMDPVAPGFRPSEQQMIAFQRELRVVIQKSGL